MASYFHFILRLTQRRNSFQTTFCRCALSFTKSLLVFIPLGVPGFIFGFIYLGVTAYLDRKGDGNINHSAYMFGALAGIGLLLIFGFAMSPYNLVENFIEQVKGIWAVIQP